MTVPATPLLGFAPKSLAVGTGYAVWVGIGAVGVEWPAAGESA